MISVCFSETGVIGGVSVLSIDSQSSAAWLGGEVSLSFSRFCSFFGSLSRRTFSHPEGCAHPRCGGLMPSTRSQAGADAPAGEAAEVVEALEEAAAELSAETLQASLD